MKKVFYLFTVTIFLFACVFSSGEKDKGPEHVNVTSPPPETDAAPSTGNHINVDTSAIPNEAPANSGTPPATTPGSAETGGKFLGAVLLMKNLCYETALYHFAGTATFMLWPVHLQQSPG